LKRGSRSSLIVNSECTAVDGAGDVLGIHFDVTILSDKDPLAERQGAVLRIELVLSDGRYEGGIESRSAVGHDLTQNLMK
jgi:hypothetical protein